MVVAREPAITMRSNQSAETNKQKSFRFNPLEKIRPEYSLHPFALKLRHPSPSAGEKERNESAQEDEVKEKPEDTETHTLEWTGRRYRSR